MKITRDNYEAFLLDLSEGNLSDELIIELHSFLEENPDLESFSDINIVPLKADSYSFKNSAGLYLEEINDKNRAFFFIAFHEGDLNRQQEMKVLNFVDSGPQYKEEFEKFLKSKLTAPEETFSGKQVLFDLSTEKSVKVRVLNLLLKVAAAGIILFIGMQLFTNKVTKEGKSFSELTRIQPNILAKVDADSLESDPFKTNVSESNTIFTQPAKEINKSFKPETTIYQKNKKSDFIALEKNELLNREDNKLDRIESNLPVLKSPPLENLVASAEKSLLPEAKQPETIKSNKPQTISALLKDKTGIDEILNDQGRPSIVALLNKGGEKIVGEEFIAQSSTKDTKSTVFRIGSLKVERISGK